MTANKKSETYTVIRRTLLRPGLFKIVKVTGVSIGIGVAEQHLTNPDKLRHHSMTVCRTYTPVQPGGVEGQ
jgi:hypothetical protein